MKKLFFHTPFFAETGENSKRKGLVKGRNKLVFMNRNDIINLVNFYLVAFQIGNPLLNRWMKR